VENSQARKNGEKKQGQADGDPLGRDSWRHAVWHPARLNGMVGFLNLQNFGVEFSEMGIVHSHLLMSPWKMY
jgi:hypothetical protein